MKYLEKQIRDYNEDDIHALVIDCIIPDEEVNILRQQLLEEDGNKAIALERLGIIDIVTANIDTGRVPALMTVGEKHILRYFIVSKGIDKLLMKLSLML